jgi:cell division septum initiation protein DivIVA
VTGPRSAAGSARLIERPPHRPQTPQQRLAAARSWAQRTDSHEALEPLGTVGPVNERMQAVIGAAERAAAAIREDAEQQARRHLAEAQHKADRLTAERVRMIAQLTDDLIRHAAVVQQRSARMLAALERATADLDRRLAASGTGASGPAQPSSTSLEAAR